MKEWVRMPSYWLRSEPDPLLASLHWIGPSRSDHIAALMLYMVLVHHANDQPTTQFESVGWAAMTYSEISDITGLSRAKIAGGLRILAELDAIEISAVGRRNLYHVNGFGEPSGWAKLPARGLYSRDLRRIPAFHALKLRSRVELHALKAYLMIVALRNNKTNYAIVSYERLGEYTGIARNDIKPALSLLVTQALIYVDQGDAAVNTFSTMNMYRPRYLDTYRHRGTVGRSTEFLAN